MVSPKAFRSLGTDERTFLCKHIASLVPIARKERHPMHEIALYMMSMALWRWTADGVGPERVVKRDAMKYDTARLPITKAARSLLMKKRPGARHEHVVPRIYLARLIRDENMSAAQIERLLRRLCLATVITKEQDRGVKPRDSMPEGWNWRTGDPYARYPAPLRKHLGV